MIWDLHCHLMGVPGRTAEERMAQLIEYADRLGIERLCVYMGPSLMHNPTPEQLREENDYILAGPGALARSGLRLRLCQRRARRGQPGRDRPLRPRRPDGRHQAVGRQASQRPPSSTRSSSGPRQLRRSSSSTPGSRPTTRCIPARSTPDDLVALARRHPDVPLICGHTGGTWELGIRAVRAYPNDLDRPGRLGSHQPASWKWPFANWAPERDHLRQRRRRPQLRFAIGQSLRRPLARRARQALILGGNLRRMMTPILKAKGIKIGRKNECLRITADERGSTADLTAFGRRTSALDPRPDSSFLRHSSFRIDPHAFLVDINVYLSRWPLRRVPRRHARGLVELLAAGRRSRLGPAASTACWLATSAGSTRGWPKIAAAQAGTARAVRHGQSEAARLGRRPAPLPRSNSGCRAFACIPTITATSSTIRSSPGC